jgi:hypothetical protein
MKRNYYDVNYCTPKKNLMDIASLVRYITEDHYSLSFMVLDLSGDLDGLDDCDVHDGLDDYDIHESMLALMTEVSMVSFIVLMTVVSTIYMIALKTVLQYVPKLESNSG